MSPASSVTARLMETWAHGQDILDTLGIARVPTARLRHVADLGIRALRYSYAVNGLAVPADPIRVELAAPDGQCWTWGPADARDRVAGDALDFCLVVTQRRHRDDTRLEVRGPVAAQWIGIAQAFAGAAGPGRPPDTSRPTPRPAPPHRRKDAEMPPDPPARPRARSGSGTRRASSATAWRPPARWSRAAPIDVLTGDYLAELTMLILWKARQKDPDAGYARTVLAQLEQVLGTCLDRGIKIVNNAGGLNPAGLAGQFAALAERLGLHPKIAYVTGDDLLPRLDELTAAGHGLRNLDTGQSLADAGDKPVTANAYLGGWGITAALDAGADIVICPRVTDASLVTGPAAWWHGWGREDFDQLAGAVAAGHVIECGPQATGGNYSYLHEITDRRYPGFPIAEVARDGSSVITKHAGTGGLVSVGTVTAQLLYEIAEPAYLNPDVVAHFDTITVEQQAPHRVRLSGTRGTPPPPTLKVCVNFLGGYRNTMTLVLTGLDIEEKAAWAQDELFAVLGGRDQFADVDVRLLRFDHPDAPSNEQAVSAPARHREGPRPARGRPALLQRHDGARPRRLRGLPHHDPAVGGERLRHLLADDGARQRGRARRRAARRHPARHTARLRHRQPRPPYRLLRPGRRRAAPARRRTAARRRARRAAAPPAGADGAGTARPGVRGPLRRQGRQRQRRAVDPRRDGLPLAARLPHGRAAARAAARRHGTSRSAASSSLTCTRSTS